MERISLGTSRVLTLTLIFAHLSALVLLWLTDIPWWLKGAVVPLFLGSLVLSLRGHAWRANHYAVIALELDDDCHGVFLLRSGQEVEGRLLESSFVAPWLTVINLRPEESWRVRHAVILPDAIEKEAFRRLRVQLRWKCAQAKPG